MHDRKAFRILNADIFVLAKPAKNRTKLTRNFANYRLDQGGRATRSSPASNGSVRVVLAASVVGYVLIVMESSASPKGPWSFLYRHDAAVWFWAALSKVVSRKKPNREAQRRHPFVRHECLFRLAENPTIPEKENFLAQTFRSLAVFWDHTCVPLPSVTLRCLVQNECRAPQKI